ncbi:BspA family leucine-rich repeat surface protein, partial [Enterococcus faecalis]|uniref:BspA family leucine-rich repeat surface protein n=1 Tax=Enterococcus faecalis TaxID=1351 RepID=UPI001A97C3F5
KEIIEKVLEKDSLLPTNPSVPSVQPDTNPSDTEQKETSPSEKEKSQKQEETTANDLTTEENNKEAAQVQETEDSSTSNSIEVHSQNTQIENEKGNNIPSLFTVPRTIENLEYSSDWLVEHFDAEWKDDGGYFLVKGIKNLDDPTKIILPSRVYDSSNPESKYFDIQVPQGFWDDIKGKPQNFKDRIISFEIKEQGGYKINSWNNESWNLAFLFGFGRDLGKDLGYQNIESINLEGINWDTVTLAQSMFQNLSKLKTVNLGSDNNYSNIEDTSFMFNNTLSLETITGLENANFSNVINMNSMFQSTLSLQSIPVETWTVQKVNDLSYIFFGSGILKANLSSWNVSKVQKMASMFTKSKITTANLSGWTTPLVENISELFYGCSSLISLDLSNWNVSNVNDMSRVFQACSSLTSLDLSSWNVSSVKNMGAMFQGTTSLTSLNLSNWNTPSLEETWWMFVDSGIKELDLTMLSVSNVTNMSKMFRNNSALEKLNISTWKTDKTNVDMTQMFAGATNLKEVDMRGFTNLDSQTTTELLGTGQAANPIMLIVQDSPGNQAFRNRDFQKESGRIPMPMPLLKTSNEHLTLTDGSTESVYSTTITVIPSTLEKTTFDAWLQKQTPQSKVIGNNFYYVKDVTPSKDVSSATSVLDLLDVTYTVNIVESDWEFKYDSTDGTYELLQYLGTNPNVVVPNEIDGKPTKIDLSSGIKTPNLGDPKTTVTSITFDASNGKKSHLKGDRIKFSSYSALTSFDGSGLDTTGLQNLNSFLFWCTSLEKVNVQGWDTSLVNDMTYLFNHNHKLTSIIGLNTWNVSNVEIFYATFNECHSITDLDLSNWVTSSAKNMTLMFDKTFKLKNLDIRKFVTSNVTNFNYMFSQSGIEKLDLNNFDLSSATDLSGLVNQAENLSELNISHWNPTQTNISMTHMLKDTPNLRKVDMSGFTNLDSQTTTNLLGTSQAPNPIMLIVQDNPGNKTFLDFDFVKESGRSVYSEFPKLVANGGKFEDNSNELSYINKICVTPEQL